VQGDFRKPGKSWRKLVPKPFCHDFQGGVFEAGSVVEGGVIEFFYDGADFGRNFPVVIEKAGLGLDGTGDGNFQNEAVPVDAAALVAFWEGGQVLGSLEIKLPFEGDSHPDVLEGNGVWGNRRGK
jgi:hypothetical protein